MTRLRTSALLLALGLGAAGIGESAIGKVPDRSALQLQADATCARVAVEIEDADDETSLPVLRIVDA